MIEFVHQILHLNEYLPIWMQDYGTGIYILLFLIIFCETGVVVAPFLPGDSLLFALGALTTASSGGLDYGFLSVLLVTAAFLGDNLNYTIGKFLGHKVLAMPDRKWLNKAHIYRTQDFMRKHGKFAVILARFVPIMRTFTPFVAGLGAMRRKTFLVYSLIGAIAWSQIFLGLGHFFGQSEIVKKNFSLFVLALVIIPGLPVVYTLVKSRLQASASNSAR